MEENTNGKSICSLLLGLLSMITPYLGMILGMIGLVGAFLALKEIKNLRIKEGIYQKGESLAVIGIILSILGAL